jgi:hypothetical protein
MVLTCGVFLTPILDQRLKEEQIMNKTVKFTFLFQYKPSPLKQCILHVWETGWRQTVRWRLQQERCGTDWTLGVAARPREEEVEMAGGSSDGLEREAEAAATSSKGRRRLPRRPGTGWGGGGGGLERKEGRVSGGTGRALRKTNSALARYRAS